MLGQSVDGRLLTLHGRDFTFHVTEPLGWKLDTRGAPQISNFMFYPMGTDWRKAGAVVFVRFAERKPEEHLEQFVAANREQFEEDCPFAEDAVRPPLEPIADFETQMYVCPGVRTEVIAVTEVSRFFIVFILGIQQQNALQSSLPVFEKIVRSFEWVDREPPANPIGPNLTPEPDPRERP